MELIINCKTLKKLTSFVGQAIKANPIVPILGDVIFTTSKNKLFAKGTDLNTTLIMSANFVKSSLPDGESFTFDLKKLSSLLSSIPAEVDLKIKVGKDVTKHVISWNYQGSVGRQSLNGNNPADYPERAKLGKDAVTINLDETEAPAFVESIRQVAFICEGNNAPHPIYTGFNMRCDANSFTCALEFAAMDGLTLAYNDLMVKDEPKADLSIIVPRSFVPLLKSAYEANEGANMSIAFNSRMIQVILPSTVLSIQLVDEKYPPYEQMLPQYDGFFSVAKDTILQTLERAINTCSFYEKSILLLVNKEGPGRVNIYSQNVELAIFNDETLTVKELRTPGDLRLCINGKTLQQVIKAMVGDDITFRFGTTEKRSLSCIIGASGTETQALVMGIDEIKLGNVKELIGRK